METFRFLEWDVYKLAKRVTGEIYKISSEFPVSHRHELGDQINRSALSIALNIAEGSGRSSDMELKRFMNIAMGSIYETVASLDIARENGFISESKFYEIKDELLNIAQQISGFKRKILKTIGFKKL